MPISIRCPTCGAKVNAKDTARGKTLPCPKCKKAITVPGDPGTEQVNVDLFELLPEEPLPAPIPSKPLHGEVVGDRRREPLAFTDDDEDEEGHIVVRGGGRTHIHVHQRRQHSHSLGIAAMVLAIVSVCLFCIPFAGLGLSLLACLLAVVGLLVSGSRSGTGIGFGIAGLAIALVGVGLGGFSTYTFFVIGRAAQDVGASFTKAAQEQEAGKAKQFSAAGRVDASRETVLRGDVAIKVTSVLVGKVAGRSLGETTESEKDLLQIRLEITNQSEAKKLDYETWAGREFSILNNDVATLRDDAGNEYKRVTFGFGSDIDGRVKSNESIYPGKKLSDLLVFEVPVEQAEWLFLDLPAKNFSGTGVVRFKIPKSMVKR